ncbi:hypothetical protein [Clostridium tertium]|uniref:hypothetical protein n=1 Tax=Clostridium tertium TaxID=1559 RepID=UPI0023B2958C|nr:hypothetical protein [Clostridium tertium]
MGFFEEINELYITKSSDESKQVKDADDIVYVYYKRKARQDVVYYKKVNTKRFYTWTYHMMKAEERKGIITILNISSLDIKETFGLKVVKIECTD